MPARPSAVELLDDLARVLGSRRWYLFGAQAVNVHGRPRMTADVDVTVEVQHGEEVDQLLEQLDASGFLLRVADHAAFLQATSVLPLVHERTGMPLDLVVADSGLEALFFDRAEPRDIGGLTVPVIHPSDLLLAKILAGRIKDIDDAIGVVRERGDEIDLHAVRDLLSQIEQALDQSDLVPRLDDVMAAVQRKPRPRPPARRRAKRRKR